MKILHVHRVPEIQDKEYFRNYAQKHFTQFYPSNKGVKKAIRKNLFLLNEEYAKTGSVVKPGDVIKLLEEPLKLRPVRTKKFNIVYEDDHCAVINKPAGIPTHGNGLQNVAMLIGQNLKESMQTDKLIAPHPVHRLDSPTSGLLIIAKSRSFQVRVGQMFEAKKIIKRYTAISLGALPPEGTFNQAVNDQRAITNFRCIDQMEDSKFGALSLVRLFPESGRTHQLRIHCAEAGYPILGERKYATEIQNLKGKGLFLCADKLSFDHPVSGSHIELKIDLPTKFRKYFFD